MFRDISQVKEHCTVNPQEEEALGSPMRPIVLLEQRSGVVKAFAAGVNNTSRFVGAFLPSFGLQYLLLDALGPLVMTSANISDLPIITNDADILSLAEHTGDGSFCVEHTGDGSFCVKPPHDDNTAKPPSITGILYNERRIAAGLDDSIVRIIDNTTQLIRRSKGYVPSPVYLQAADILTKDKMIFAAGAHLKSAFALSKGAYSYLSRHIGDIETIEAETVYRETFDRMKAFFDIEPTLAVCDMHPRYYPTRFAESLGLPLLYVQHHHAHIASVMAEHGLRGPVTGVAFDGTGYGEDKAIWGGEILVCEDAEFERFSHLSYVDMIGGDESMKDAWKSAVAHLHSLKQHEASIVAGRGKTGNSAGLPESAAIRRAPGTFGIDLADIIAFCEEHGTLDGKANDRIAVEAALRAGKGVVKTSSMGRLFDAVCAMLGIHYENRYEGECAIMLENAARRAAIKQTGRKERPLLSVSLLSEQERLALSFHTSVAQEILLQCTYARDEYGIRKVALSGGVFQNKVLMEETLRLLRKEGFAVYYNIHVPPNDGGIALGQNYIGMLSIT